MKIRKMIGKIIEWFISYDHTVKYLGVNIPYRKYGGDAGYDLYCDNDVVVGPGLKVDVPTGIFIDPQEQVWFELRGRSSSLHKLGILVDQAVIDKDYRGELYVVAYNTTSEMVTLEKGSRIAQIVPHRLIPVHFELGELSDSERGKGGFGSTGE